jgi:dTMP kinase
MSGDGLLIAVEGIDGSGKSTAVDRIAEVLSRNDVSHTITKEPSDEPTGEWVYESLSDDESGALTDFFMFMADRSRHVENVVSEALSDGEVVVTDRYADSTRAYQTHRVADALGWTVPRTRRWLRDMMDEWTPEPDVVLYLDVSVDTALERCDRADKFETREVLREAKAEYEAMYGLEDGAAPRPSDADVYDIDGSPDADVVGMHVDALLYGVLAENDVLSLAEAR